MCTKTTNSSLNFRNFSGVKISILAVLLAFGFTACQSEIVEPNSSIGTKSKSGDKPDKKVFADEERPPREPDPGGN